MVSTLKSNKLCMNCLKPARQCKSLHRCRNCQKPHRTLLHLETKEPPVDPIPAHAAIGLNSNAFLMTCHVMVDTLDGSSVEAHAILDCASSASFISERLAQSLCLERSHQGTWRCWSFTEVPPSIYYQLH